MSELPHPELPEREQSLIESVDWHDWVSIGALALSIVAIVLALAGL